MGIQMEKKQVTKTFKMISNWKKPPWFRKQYFSVVGVKETSFKHCVTSQSKVALNIDTYSAGTDFRRQILTSIDVKSDV